MAQVVIADAGPLIGLARAGSLELLRELFGQLVITETVAQEIGVLPQENSAQGQANGINGPGTAVLQAAIAAGWLQICPEDPSDWEPYRPLNPGVDAGEASAIGLALRWKAAGQSVLLIVDDRCGRAEARRQGLEIIGTAAVLLIARERGLLQSCRPLLETLRQQGYYLSDALLQAVLDQAGES